jgi:NitT/TauT family transport system substrate-binding protein
MRAHRSLRLSTTIAAIVVAGVAFAACGSDDGGGSSASAGATPETKASTEPVTLRLGYFPNVTHAPAIVGIEGGIFEKSFSDNVTLEPTSFNAGPDVITAILAGQLDASFIGPGPSISGFQQSNGEAIRIVSGAASGGAFLVVKPEIKDVDDLKGKTLSTPQLGNTQDVALRAWLKEEGLETDTSGGGDVSILPQENSLTLTTFQSGDIDGAWVPEPWATRLIEEGGGKILVDEADLWPDGKYVTTNVIVATSFLNDHPDVVKQLIEGEIDSIDYIETNTKKAEEYTATGIEKASGKPIAPELVTASFENLTFTVDPIPSSLVKDAKDAKALGLIDSADVKGVYDLKILNRVLKANGEPAIEVRP